MTHGGASCLYSTALRGLVSPSDASFGHLVGLTFFVHNFFHLNWAAELLPFCSKKKVSNCSGKIVRETDLAAQSTCSIVTMFICGENTMFYILAWWNCISPFLCLYPSGFQLYVIRDWTNFFVFRWTNNGMGSFGQFCTNRHIWKGGHAICLSQRYNRVRGIHLILL